MAILAADKFYIPLIPYVISDPEVYKEDYKLVKEFLKSLTKEDKAKFISKGHFVSLRRLDAFADALVEIVDPNKEIASAFILETIISYLKSREEFFLKERQMKEWVALRVLEAYCTKPKLEHIVSLYDLAKSYDVVSDLSKLLLDNFPERAKDIFQERMYLEREEIHFHTLVRQRRYNALSHYVELAQKESIDNLAGLLDDKDPVIVCAAAKYLLDFDNKGKEKLFSKIQEDIEHVNKSRALAAVTWMTRYFPRYSDFVINIFSSSDGRKLRGAYRIISRLELCKMREKKNGFVFTLNSVHPGVGSILKGVINQLAELAVCSDNEVLRSNIVSVMELLSLRELKKYLKPEVLDLFFKAAGIHKTSSCT